MKHFERYVFNERPSILFLDGDLLDSLMLWERSLQPLVAKPLKGGETERVDFWQVVERWNRSRGLAHGNLLTGIVADRRRRYDWDSPTGPSFALMVAADNPNC
jgi:hypothetical protein